MSRIGRKIVPFVGVAFKVEELWPISYIMDVFESAIPDCERTGSQPHSMIFAEHRSIWPLPVCEPSDGKAGVIRFDHSRSFVTDPANDERIDVDETCDSVDDPPLRNSVTRYNQWNAGGFFVEC